MSAPQASEMAAASVTTHASTGTASWPDLTWVRAALRYNATSHVDYRVLDAFVVGSVARGTARPDSDLDIAVVIPRAPRVSALSRTERYHAKFTDDRQKPRWDGRIVDFQFFEEGAAELAGYTRIKLHGRDRGGAVLNMHAPDL